MNKTLAATAAAALGVLAAIAGPTPKAAAAYECHTNVGCLRADYYNAASAYPRTYRGVKSAHPDWTCVTVERKTSTGAWTTAGIYEPEQCGGLEEFWAIRDPDYAAATYGLRLRNAHTTIGFNICSTKSACLAL